jgi:hypothetical protein
VLQRQHWHGQIPGVGLPFPAVGGVTPSGTLLGWVTRMSEPNSLPFYLINFHFLFFTLVGSKMVAACNKLYYNSLLSGYNRMSQDDESEHIL